ncbi:hypothetical protein GCM10029964_102270 [Kibdelosporangium lantanae]
MPETARETVARFIPAAATLTDRGDLADFYAEDAVVEIMFRPPGSDVPARTQGREVLRARFAASTGRFALDRVGSAVIHQTDDPEVVVAEYDLHGHAVATGKEFVFSYVMVVRVRDGLIVHSRDYGNPLAAQEALG